MTADTTKKMEKKRRIIETAYQLFQSVGISATAVDDVVKAAGIPANAPLSSLSEEDLRSATRTCTDFVLPVRGVDGFDAAQVTAGGLLTESFRPDTLESRLVPGLFACGELLDIDGPCGGYNLQWAWASGRLAGRLGS